MDDGSLSGSGLKLHTNAFTLEELNLLIKSLEQNFSPLWGLKQPLILLIEKNHNIQYIFQKNKCLSPLGLKELVMEHIHPDMLYKLNIE